VRKSGISFIILSVVALATMPMYAQSATDPGAPASGLDLYAAAEIFKDSQDLQSFEQKLNNPDNGQNAPHRAAGRPGT
jgi:hypothetical protein